METVKVKPSKAMEKSKRWKIRSMTADQFIDNHASGTLRKNRRIGMTWKQHYLHERVAFEFGYGFEILPASRIIFGDARSEGDCAAITEAGWFCERHMALSVFPEDHYEVKYIEIETDGHRREGIGMVLRATSAPWIPDGNVVFAIVTEYDPFTHDFKKATNPS